MKSFLEEYGFAILAAIVIILLIAMASPLGDIIRTQLSNIVNKFATSANKKLDAADAGDATAVVAGTNLTITAQSSTDKFKGILHGIENGMEVTYTLTETEPFYSKNPTAGTYDNYGMVGNGLVTTKNYAKAVKNLDEGSEFYIEVIDEGTGTHFNSNRVKVTKAMKNAA